MGNNLVVDLDLYEVSAALIGNIRRVIEPCFVEGHEMSDDERVRVYGEVVNTRAKLSGLGVINPVQWSSVAPYIGGVVYAMICYENILEDKDSDGLASVEAERALNEAELGLMTNDGYKKARGEV